MVYLKVETIRKKLPTETPSTSEGLDMEHCRLRPDYGFGDRR
jgi:hypothetical protein